jgi:hypothetical protein
MDNLHKGDYYYCYCYDYDDYDYDYDDDDDDDDDDGGGSKCSVCRYKMTEQWDSCGMSRTWMVASVVFMEYG